MWYLVPVHVILLTLAGICFFLFIFLFFCASQRINLIWSMRLVCCFVTYDGSVECSTSGGVHVLVHRISWLPFTCEAVEYLISLGSNAKSQAIMDFFFSFCGQCQTNEPCLKLASYLSRTQKVAPWGMKMNDERFAKRPRKKLRR